MLSLAARTSGSVRDGGTTSGCAGIYLREGEAKGDRAGDLDADADGDRDGDLDAEGDELPVGPVVCGGVGVGVADGDAVLVGVGALDVGAGVLAALGEGCGVKVGTGAWSRCRAARLAGGGKPSTGLLSSVSRIASVHVRVG